MLIGQYQAVITNKERLVIPSRFRNDLGSRIIVTKWLEGCLVVVSEARWNEIVDRLLGKREIGMLSVREIERFILGSAFEVNLDGQGRFVVPQILREYAEIEKDVVMVGLGDRLEIWDKSSWNKKQLIISKEAAKMTEELRKD